MKLSEPRTPALIGISFASVASSVAASDRIEAAIHRGDARELDVTVVHRESFVVHEHRPVTARLPHHATELRSRPRLGPSRCASDHHLQHLLALECLTFQAIWSQPRAFSQEYTLTAGDRVLASLRWPKTFGSLAEGRIGDASWAFKRVGFWRPAVTIRRPETGDQDVARFVMGWRRGDLILPGGVRYHWDQVSFWKAEWAFFDAAGRLAVRAFDG